GDAWPYRDYVIKAFNADKRYDEFVREQLAADEYAADDPEKLIGTAFLRHGVYEWNQRNAEMQWELILNEMTNVTGEVFLGLGIGCAQCHDHKFDPILQRDYYALQSFLGSVWWPEHRPLATPGQVAEYEAKLALWEEKTAAVRAEIDGLTGEKRRAMGRAAVERFPPEVKAMYSKPAAERTAYEEQVTALVQRQVEGNEGMAKFDAEKALAKDKAGLARYEALQVELAKFAELKPRDLDVGFVATDVGPKGAKISFMGKGGETEVEPAFLTLLGQPAPKIRPTATTTGRRLALADWIASPDNPLSTRVIVNRVWQHHFGTGIVATPNDFGMLGEPPSHPELLDWLAAKFVEGGWSLKALHREVVTSAAYRQTARREPDKLASNEDPGNRLLWRFSPRRLSAEQVRDALLAVSGELGERVGGRSVAGTEKVRSLYVKKMRNTPDPVLGAFDAPTGFDSAAMRQETTTPTQSLLLANNAWPLERARGFAKKLLKGKKEIGEGEVRRAFLEAFGREAEVREVVEAREFLQAQREEYRAGGGEVLAEKVKFPKENGLRPVGQYFNAVVASGEVALGDNALWLQPTSRFERLEVPGVELGDGAFSVEAVVVLDAIQKDASVNTIVSRWDGGKDKGGWSLGVTSAKSRYEPRNLIMQLVGRAMGGDVFYEVVASGLKVPTGEPVYVAAVVEPGVAGNGRVRFFMRELAASGAELQTAEVASTIVAEMQPAGVKTLIGGRDGGGHLWDGQMGRVAIADGVLGRSRLLVSEGATAAEGGDGRRVVDWVFGGEGTSGEEPAPGGSWVRAKAKGGNGGGSMGVPGDVLGAMTDFCHALMSSNEFLYLH
ncbi:MAG: DUF1553 domain-containing protein, partial [Verrucomicrobiales bacterium]|nr:DUF1553 domain-containing protein [Verrucomicrobiales bacterium]